MADPATVLVLGARSDIGRFIARRYARAGHPIILAARQADELAANRDDIAARYNVACRVVDFDVLDPDPDAFFDRLGSMPEIVIMVAGLLGDHAVSVQDTQAARRVLDTNFSGPVLFLLAAARRMSARGNGLLIGISSVAGDRGRGSNYVYGASKAGLSAVLSGMRNALARQGVHVMTVKPGFVATRMTAGLKLPPRLTARPEQVAEAIFTAGAKRRDVIYVLPVWRLIMGIITHVPERLFKRLKL